MKVNLQVLDNNRKKYVFKKSVNLESVPRKDEKFALKDEDGSTNVHLVYDVIYSETGIELLLIRQHTATEYQENLGIEIV